MSASNHHARFQGFPYLITRVVPSLYHVIVLPADLETAELEAIGRAQILANRLVTALVLGNSYVWYFDTSGMAKPHVQPPTGGWIVTGRLAPVADFTGSAELLGRRQELEAFQNATRSADGCLFGDLTKGGRDATDDEIHRLAGIQPGGVPTGLSRCESCGEWRGACLDPSPQLPKWIVTVHCVCENHNRCARCGQHLYHRRLNANYFNEADGRIWHVPGFCAFSHRCGQEIGRDEPTVEIVAADGSEPPLAMPVADRLETVRRAESTVRRTRIEAAFEELRRLKNTPTTPADFVWIDDLPESDRLIVT